MNTNMRRGENFDFNAANEVKRGLYYHQNGKINEAEKIYKKIIRIFPQHADALHLLGVIANQKGEKDTAISLIEKAIQINPYNSVYYNNLGNAYIEQGRADVAILCYEKALPFKKNLADIYLNLGNALKELGHLDKAISSFKEVLRIKPDCAEAYYSLGNAFKEKNIPDEEIACYQKAAELSPNFTDALYNLGNSYNRIGEKLKAIACYQECLQLNPNSAEVYNNLGSTLKELGNLEEAVSCFQKSIEINPDFSQAYSNSGNVLRDMGYYAEAISFYQKALQLTPENADAYLNFGITLSDQGRSAEAIICFQKASQLKPDFAEANNHIGVYLWNQGKFDQAVFYFKRAIQIKPDYTSAYSHLVHLLQYICDWRQVNHFSEKLDELTAKALNNKNTLSEPPFICLSRHSSLSHNLNVAKTWSHCISRPVRSYGSTFSFDGRRDFSNKITVGYLSSDFYDHATAHLMLKLFGLHNRDEFNVYCYSYGLDDESLYQEKIKLDCDKFINIREESFMDAAKRIFEDEVDILVDLKGHTKGGRLSICAFRPAPIQVHYLGFPGTTGADFIDYIITDRTVTPEGHEPYYSEKLVFLPHCYQVNDHEQVISDRIWEKEELHLPEGNFVFCSFNQSYKIEPLIFDSWMNILQQIPESVLWLFDEGETIRRHLRLEAHSRGINPERLVFAEKYPKAEHLSRLVHAQLALDTRIVNGHTTTSDALWAGVPVITLQGSHFASRVSSSLLNSIGLSELITHNIEEYEKLAIRLASTPLELKTIRNKLFQNRFTDPLFDTPRFTKNLEKAYKKMWNIFLEERKPEQIAVLEV